jgi:predicted phage-related endonuclease
MKTKLTPIIDDKIWLEKRGYYITSTESASLFGFQMASRPTAFELYHIKRGLIEQENVQNNFMQWGKLLEKTIVEIIKQDNPEWKISPMRVFAHDDADRIGSSFDNVILHPEKGHALLEIKTTTYREWKERFIQDDDGEFIEAPAYYEIQCQHELETLNKYDWICLAVAILDTREIKYIWRERDLEMGKAIRSKIKWFWNLKEPPDPNLVKDSDLLARMQRANSSDKVFDATKHPEFDIWAMAYCDANKAIAQAEETKKRTRSQMLLAMGDCNAAWCNVAKIGNKNSFRVTETKGK